jgi:hypothetical protein
MADKELKWYEFSQNNSGGSFVVNENLSHRVYIQALDTASAISKAEDMGIYFNGCEDGRDRSCCGDRWHEPYGEVKFPLEYGNDLIFKNIEEYAQYLADEYGWTRPDIYLHYANGDKKKIYKKEPTR